MAWKEFRDGVGTVVMATVSEDGGTRWSAPAVLASTRHASDHPLLVSDGREALLSWFSSDEGYRLLSASPAQGAGASRPAGR